MRRRGPILGLGLLRGRLLQLLLRRGRQLLRRGVLVLRLLVVGVVVGSGCRWCLRRGAEVRVGRGR